MAKKKATTRRRSGPKAAATPSFDGDTRVVILAGAEQMLKRLYLEQLRDALVKAHGEVQMLTLDGRTARSADILDELRTFSLMQQYKLVIVDQADQFLNEDTRPILEKYVATPVDHATLVLRADTWRAGRLDKLVEKVGTKARCDPLKAEKAADWIMKRCAKVHGRVLSSAAAEALIERLGTNLSKLDTEVAKLALLVGPSEPINVGLIDEVVGRSSEEQAWAVQEAVLKALLADEDGGRGVGGAAIEKLHELIDISGQPKELVIYFIADLLRKLMLASHMRRQGASDQEIANVFKLWAERRGMFLQVLRRLDPHRAGAVFDQVLRADRRSKSGFGNQVRNLECFCVQLADELR